MNSTTYLKIILLLWVLLIFGVPAIAAPPAAEPAPCHCFARVAHLKQAIVANNDRSVMTVSLYLAGVSDAGQGVLHCAPNEVQGHALLELVVPPLMAADDAEIAARVVLRVLVASYPCDAKGKPAGPSRGI